MFKLEGKIDLIDMWARGVDAWLGGSYAGEEPTHVEGAEPCRLRSRATRPLEPCKRTEGVMGEGGKSRAWHGGWSR